MVTKASLTVYASISMIFRLNFPSNIVVSFCIFPLKHYQSFVLIYWSLKIYFLTKSWILLNLIINVFWGFLFCFDKAEFRSIGCVTSKLRRVWRYQRDNQNPYIEEKRTTQWPKEKVQKDKQRSTKEEFEDTTGLIRIRTKEKNRQHNGQK